MIRKLLLISLIVCICLETSFADEIDDLLKKALDAKNTEVGGDSSARQRYLYEILQKDPDHLEALWQVTGIKLNSIPGSTLNREAPYLSALGPDINKILRIAEFKNDKAYYHYVNAVYASAHKAFDIALTEIEKSIKIEPNSARYLLNKGKILLHKGRWTSNDNDLEQAISVIVAAHKLSKKHENPFHSPWHYNFLIASANTNFKEPKWHEAVNNYERVIEIIEHVQATKTSQYAHAWNNVSYTSRKLGDCKKSLEAAEKALKIMEFGAAKNQKLSAELCIEMQQMLDGYTVKSK